MTKKLIDGADKLRIQVVATKQQAAILDKAADAAKCSDRSTWILAHALKAADAQDAERAPIVIGGDIADRLRAEASRQGITADRMLEQLLITSAPQ